MKLNHRTTLSLLAVAAFALAGCASTHASSDLKPSVSLNASQKVINTGDSTTVTASTENLAADSKITWQVSPSTAKLSVESSDPSGLHARFMANEPGTYIVKATAKAGDGTTTSDETNITVNGPITNSKW